MHWLVFLIIIVSISVGLYFIWNKFIRKVDCSVSEWTECDASCGGGKQTRTVITPQGGRGNSCPPLSQPCNTRACNAIPCEVSEWIRCSADCGGGTQTRTITQQPSTGESCPPLSQPCNTQPCPVNCAETWSGDWSFCSPCLKTQTQKSTVITQPNNGGTPCVDTQTQSCSSRYPCNSTLGQTFTKISGEPVGKTWSSITISNDGKYILATTTNEYIYVSSDYGTSFNQQIADKIRAWTACSMSVDGKYMVAISPDEPVYLSSDYGSSWKSVMTSSKGWADCDMSDSGQYIGVTSMSIGLSLSTDYGNTWNNVIVNGHGFNIDISNTGQYMCQSYHIGDQGSFSQYSSNYGTTWVTMPHHYANMVSFMSKSGQYAFSLDNWYGSLADNSSMTSDYGVSFTYPSYLGIDGLRNYSGSDNLEILIKTKTVNAISLDKGHTFTVSVPVPFVSVKSNKTGTVIAGCSLSDLYISFGPK
jgi:hypothetical protein